MCYSIEPGDRIYLKGYEFLSFAKNIGKNATKVAKSMNNTYSARKATTDNIKLLQEEQFRKLKKQLVI